MLLLIETRDKNQTTEQLNVVLNITQEQKNILTNIRIVELCVFKYSSSFKFLPF